MLSSTDPAEPHSNQGPMQKSKMSQLSCGAIACACYFKGTGDEMRRHVEAFKPDTTQSIVSDGLFESEKIVGVAIIEGYVKPPKDGMVTFLVKVSKGNNAKVWSTEVPNSKKLSDLEQVANVTPDYRNDKKVHREKKMFWRGGQTYYVKAKLTNIKKTRDRRRKKAELIPASIKVGLEMPNGKEMFPIPMSLFAKPSMGLSSAPNYRIVKLEKTLVVGNTQMCLGQNEKECPTQINQEGQPESLGLPKNWTGLLCPTVDKCRQQSASSTVHDNSVEDWVENGIYRGVKAQVLLNRDQTLKPESAITAAENAATHKHKCNMGCSKSKDPARICPCPAFVEVSGHRQFTTNAVVIRFKLDNGICSVKPQNPCRTFKLSGKKHGEGVQKAQEKCKMGYYAQTPAPYLRIALHYRQGHSGEWQEYDRTFFVYKGLGEVNLKLAPVIRATQLRFIMVCTPAKSPNALPMQFLGWPHKEPVKTERSHPMPVFEGFHEVRVGVMEAVSAFGWDYVTAEGVTLNDTVASLLPSKITQKMEIGEGMRKEMGELNCKAVNNNTVLRERFSQWRTSEDGLFAQDPQENADPPYVLINGWEVMVSKRRASYPANQAEHLYDLEKNMLCTKKHNDTNSTLTCCVSKDVILVRNETRHDQKTMNTAAAQLRNF